MNRERIGPALGKIASGLYIATGMLRGAPVGMLCSFVEQASFTPPMISFALGRDRILHEVLRDGGVFGLNILSKDNARLMASFSRSDVADPFAGHELVPNPHGVPQFSHAVAFLACKAAGQIDAGDHLLYVAEVLDGELQRPGLDPMVRIRKDGFGY